MKTLSLYSAAFAISLLCLFGGAHIASATPDLPNGYAPQTNGGNNDTGFQTSTNGGNNDTGYQVDTTGGNAGGLQNPLGFSTIPEFLTAVLGLLVTIGSIVIVIMIVYVGFLFVVAQGAEEKIKEARQALLYTVIGALVLLGAQAISSGIQATVSALQSGNTGTTGQTTSQSSL